MDFKRLENEEFDDYFVRLFTNKQIYGLNCDRIAELLNFEKGTTFGESAWRKEWAAFNRGIRYEKTRQSVGVAIRILSLSDFHIPYQLPKETFKDYVGCVDILQLNGDIIDSQSLSKFDKAYRIPIMEEIIMGRQYLIDLIEYINPKVVMAVYGNHDARFATYLNKHIDNDMLELMPHTPLDLIFIDGFNHYDKRNHTKVWYEPLKNVFKDTVDVQYDSDWKCQIGSTLFVHPLAFNSGILKTAERALMYFRNEGFNFSSLVMAHTHRIGCFEIGNTTIYEQGCCNDTKANNYHNGKLVMSQKEGFIYICQDKNGDIIKDKTQLVCLN